MKEYPNKEEIFFLLNYNETTGVFKWKSRNIHSWDKKYAGKEAGYKNKKGYIQIQILGSNYMAHRLAWIFVNGSIEGGKEIDHKDCDPSNNKIDNLRTCIRSENVANRRKERFKKSGLPKGVNKQTLSDTYIVNVTKNGKRFYVGSFKTVKDASEAYIKKAQDLFGEFSRAE